MVKSVQNFAAAVLGTAQPAALAGTTGADRHAHGGDGAVRDHVEFALGICIVEVVATHLMLSFCFERLLG